MMSSLKSTSNLNNASSLMPTFPTPSMILPTEPSSWKTNPHRPTLPFPLIASFYLEGQALAWFQWIFNNGLLSSWKHWSCVLLPLSLMTPLQLSASLLRHRICKDTSQSLKHLPHAIVLAKLHEYKFHSSIPPLNCFGCTTTPPPLSPSPSTPPKPLLPLLPTPTNKLPIKRLTEAEIQARRDKNLYFNYDERYTRGHRCKPQFLLLTTFDSENQDDCLLSDDSTVVQESPLGVGLISLHAFSSQWTLRTFRVTGSIQRYVV
ncbi:hypothetical protein V8G54_036880 [Vigna mungo]|uniref:Uncharacterized protein n=1 Tax=Vigna mungo TaxID=3915 RepID=A0AAQ3MHJ9_VIGMU